MGAVLLKIIVNEQQREKQDTTCKKLLTYLWEQGVPGATVRRGEAGLDNRGVINYDLLEDTYFNDLPIIIESVMDKAFKDKIEGGLSGMVTYGQISSIEGMKEADLENHSHFVIKIYTRESAKLVKKDEYEQILQLMKKHKAIWGTVTKAIAGYGSDRVIYGRHLFSPGEHLPLVIECIADREHLPLLLDELKAVVTEGAVFIAPVILIMNK